MCTTFQETGEHGCVFGQWYSCHVKGQVDGLGRITWGELCCLKYGQDVKSSLAYCTDQIRLLNRDVDNANSRGGGNLCHQYMNVIFKVPHF